MRLTLVRSATVILEIGELRLLVDPMLADAGAYPAYENTQQPAPNPLVPLPMPIETVLDGIDAVLVTHLHSDHFDAVAQMCLPRSVPILCQPVDAVRIGERGFKDVRPVETSLDLAGVQVTRVGGRHGHGAMADLLGPVSGFVFAAAGQPTVYLAGDTIWCREVQVVIETLRPSVIVLNAAGAEFLEGGLIVMGLDDVAEVRGAAPDAAVVTVHLEALNHCYLSRAELRQAGLRLIVPADGEQFDFAV